MPLFGLHVTNLWIFPISSLLAFRRRRRLRLCTGCFCVVSTICAGVSISYHDISLFVHVCAMSDIPCRTTVPAESLQNWGYKQGQNLSA